jgi:hypothetical protein
MDLRLRCTTYLRMLISKPAHFVIRNRRKSRSFPKQFN